MANARYTYANQGLAEGAFNWLTDEIKVILIDTDEYTVNLATHQFLSDVPVAARIAISSALSGKSTTDGVLGADDVTFSPIVTPVTISALVIYQVKPTEAASRLIGYMDTATNLPFTPESGKNIVIQWDNNAALKLFKI